MFLRIFFKVSETQSNVATIQNISIQKRSVEIAKQVLTIKQLQDYELEPLLGLLQGRDVVVSIPTGSGNEYYHSCLVLRSVTMATSRKTLLACHPTDDCAKDSG